MKRLFSSRSSIIMCLMLAVFVSFTLGCAPSQPRVSRVNPEKTMDLTGEWNDSDSGRVAKKMISSCLNQGWLTEYKRNHNGEKPTVIVGLFRNKSSEHIPTETFTKDIERELVNSGKVNFVAMAEERQALRSERRDQSKHATQQSAARMAHEKGADFMLQGVFNAQKQKWQGQQVIAYSTDMQLINIQSNMKAWMGSKEIKKKISQSSYSW